MATTTIPVPLESGDRLTRAEFHRRYCLRPDITKAEWIKGVVYVASPVSMRHSRPHVAAFGWLYTYKLRVPGLELGDNATVLLRNDGEVQPDLCLFRVDRVDRARLTEDEYIEGAPELVVEIAASSASYDLHDKKELYRDAGVQEYLAWQVYERRIDWWQLRDGQYVPLEPDEHGVIHSRVFPGLRLAVDKMLAGDDAGVLAALGEPLPDSPRAP